MLKCIYFYISILLFNGDDGDNDVAADSDASSESASAPFASAAAVGDDEYGDDESYGSILSEILRGGNVTYLTA